QTSSSSIDSDLTRLREGAAVWAQLPPGDKAGVLLACRHLLGDCTAEWIEAAAAAKGLAGTPLAGEEAISGPWGVLRALEAYARTLQQIERFGGPRIDPRHVTVRPGGQVVANVFPAGLADRLLLDGVRADVWMEPGVTPQTLEQTMGTWYRQSAPKPKVALVLGAGNIASIAPLDVLYKLVADGSVCMLKMNPVNHYLGPIFERAFAPLVDAGFLRFAYGGADIGKYLCSHPLVDEIHITGSDKTHDAIVFGDGPEGAERKRRNEPLLEKPITSELGNVSPTIVVPGPWSDADIAFQAENVVTQKLHNDGFNCIAAQVLILPAQWEHTATFVAAVEKLLGALPDRPAYYPGAAQRCDALATGHAEVARFGRTDAGFVPRTLMRLDADAADPALTTEAFCSLLGVVRLEGGVDTYLNDAVAFANERLRGTLGANLIVHPKTMRADAAAVDRAIADLRYGCIGVNAWTGVGFLLSDATWGAYPGHTLDDIRSGIGVVHNAMLFSQPQKSVVYAPFAPFPRSLFGYGATLLPKPPWFVTNGNQAKIGKALCRFEISKSPLDLAKVAFLAMTAR
ncbi:MAG TPA: aldehyde dehydrogenase family protein, partial [Candidatus Baltobacteraceae bacterium]|nr:aldehyde dehydrogenase family protein [Candidatus Baltobacteraceae bacterium]